MTVVVEALVVVVVLAAVLAAVAVVLASPRWSRPASANETSTNTGLAPQLFNSQGRKHYYQMPQGTPKGLLFVTPGCARWGPGFWPHDPSRCKECVGLTEDVCHTKQALARGYAIFVAWPVDRAFPGQYCWSSKDDVPSVVKVLEEFVGAKGLAGKPIYTMGASSGGSIALKMPGYVRQYAKNLKISGVLAEVSTTVTPADMIKNGLKAPFPPIVWITMSASDEIARARGHVAEYRKYGPAATIVSPPRPITPTYFSDRHPQISAKQSADLVAGLKQVGVIGNDGAVVIDLKKDKSWVGRLKKAVPWLAGDPVLGALSPTKKSAILQALNVAKSKHEHVCDYLTAAFAWFENDGRGSFDDMVAKYKISKPAALTAQRV